MKATTTVRLRHLPHHQVQRLCQSQPWWRWLQHPSFPLWPPTSTKYLLWHMYMERMQFFHVCFFFLHLLVGFHQSWIAYCLLGFTSSSIVMWCNYVKWMTILFQYICSDDVTTEVVFFLFHVSYFLPDHLAKLPYTYLSFFSEMATWWLKYCVHSLQVRTKLLGIIVVLKSCKNWRIKAWLRVIATIKPCKNWCIKAWLWDIACKTWCIQAWLRDIATTKLCKSWCINNEIYQQGNYEHKILPHL